MPTIAGRTISPSGSKDPAGRSSTRASAATASSTSSGARARWSGWTATADAIALSLFDWRFGRIRGFVVLAAPPVFAPHPDMPRVAMLAFPDAQTLDVVAPLEVFSRAARLISDEGRRGRPPYTVE